MNKNNKIIITILIVAVAAFGIIWWVGQGNNSQPQQPQPNGTVNTNGEQEPVEEQPIAADFTLIGTEYAFDVEEITVNEGDRVRVTFMNEGSMPHDFVIDEFEARTRILQPGEIDTIEFVADASGTFEYYCSVGTHRELGMVGTIIVE